MHSEGSKVWWTNLVTETLNKVEFQINCVRISLAQPVTLFGESENIYLDVSQKWRYLIYTMHRPRIHSTNGEIFVWWGDGFTLWSTHIIVKL